MYSFPCTEVSQKKNNNNENRISFWDFRVIFHVFSCTGKIYTQHFPCNFNVLL